MMRPGSEATASTPIQLQDTGAVGLEPAERPTGSTNFVPGIVPSNDDQGPSWWFCFRGDDLLVGLTQDTVIIPSAYDLSELGLTAFRSHYLGRLDGHPCMAVELANNVVAPQGMELLGLRSLFGRLEEHLFSLAGRAIQIVNWDRTHQYCGRCGTRSVDQIEERAKSCPTCGLLSFPRLSPAIIVAVVQDSRLLLAHAKHFADGFYSVLAGFVEPGETLEECVRREISEEVGIEVKDIRYFGSQPWPFPHSLMIGFTAQYAGGEITIDDKEIAAAGWFTARDLPRIPSKISIARRLIDWFTETYSKQGGNGS